MSWIRVKPLNYEAKAAAKRQRLIDRMCPYCMARPKAPRASARTCGNALCQRARNSDRVRERYAAGDRAEREAMAEYKRKLHEREKAARDLKLKELREETIWLRGLRRPQNGRTDKALKR